MTDYQSIRETAGKAVSSIDDEKLREIAYGQILNHLLWADKSESNIKKQRRFSGRDVSWVVILLMLGAAIFVLPPLIVNVTDAQLTPFLLAIAAFSIAFAIHFSGVSATICGIYIRERGDRQRKIRDIESQIVTSAHFVIAGGLAIILSSGLYLLKANYFLCVYYVGAGLLFFGVCKYFIWERGWPWKIIDVLQ